MQNNLLNLQKYYESIFSSFEEVTKLIEKVKNDIKEIYEKNKVRIKAISSQDKENCFNFSIKNVKQDGQKGTEGCKQKENCLKRKSIKCNDLGKKDAVKLENNLKRNKSQKNVK